jgi:uncharacterized protein (TIGR02996 family)
MTQDDAFLQAIIENPEDDTPRLVYADWLTDQDNPRGEFIRVQCRVARMDGADPIRKMLETSEGELLARHQEQWLGSLRPLLSRWTFRRGFLDSVVVSPGILLQTSAIYWPATVRRVEVDLDGFEVPRDTLDFVPESVARENVLLPIGFRARTLVVAVQDPLDPDILEKMRFIFNRDIELVAAPDRQVSEAIRRHYGDPVVTGEEPEFFGCLASLPTFPPDEVDLGSWGNGSPAARLLARLIAAAIGLNAREISIEPGPDHIRLRYACDEGTAEGEVTPIYLLWPVVTRLRIMAGIFADASRDVQPGAIRLTVRDSRIEADVVIRRTGDGPAVVLTFRPPDSEIGSG